MANQVQQMTPEQMAVYQQQMGIPLAQFGIPYPGTAADGSSAAGMHAQAAHAAAVAAAGGYPVMDPQMLAHHMAAAAQAPFPIPLPVGPAAPSNGTHGMGGPGSGNNGPNPRNDRHFWKENEQQELLRLVADPAYRQSLLGAQPCMRGSGGQLRILLPHCMLTARTEPSSPRCAGPPCYVFPAPLRLQASPSSTGTR